VTAFSTIFVADDGFGVFSQQEVQAAVFQRFLQHLAGDFIELALHQPLRQMHDGDIHAAQFQAVRRFQPEQAAADHDRVLVLAGRIDHRIGVGDIAIGDHALQVLARHRQHERVGAGRQQQAVIVGDGAVFRNHLTLDAVDLDDFFTQMQRDVVFRIPVDIVEHDVLHRLLAGQHRRQQDAVVIRIGFRTEYRDVVNVGRDLAQLFQCAYTRHAIADHYQFQLLHRDPQINVSWLYLSKIDASALRGAGAS